VNFLPPGQPLYLETQQNPSKVIFMNTPPGWQGPWHKDPVPQLVFFLSGTGLWTAMDGTNITLTVGDIYFGNDQASKSGHFSQNIGSNDMMLAAAQFAEWPTTNYEPCWLK